jgi:uncharacterized protein (DUF1800 family)
MTSRADLAWLTRRTGFGPAPGQLDDLAALDRDQVIARVLDPTAHGSPTPPSLFGDVDMDIPQDTEPTDRPNLRAEINLRLLDAWLDALRDSTDPLLEWLTFFWHDHFAVNGAVVLSPRSMAVHIELLRTHARGDFGAMLRDVTVDPAMLKFLDGRTNVASHPNENYGRELLELYSLGVEHYTEADVAAAATALTGWHTPPEIYGEAVFRPRRHDDTPQTLLGVDGVHDVDTVIDAVLGHEALPRFIAAKMGRAILGDDLDDSIVDGLATTFAANDLQIAPLVEAAAAAGLDLPSRTPLIRHPVSWLANAERTTGARPEARVRMRILRGMDMLPGHPPHVGGFPPPENYLSASSTAARFTVSGHLAGLIPEDAPVRVAADDGRWDELADLLGRPEGFGAATTTALDDLAATRDRGRVTSVLALALASPELLLV